MNDSRNSSLSFEVFPSNTQIGVESLIKTLDALKNLNPDFISVTCSNNKSNIEETTLKIANHVENVLHVPAVAHLPATYLNKNQVQHILDALKNQGISRVLALRGDIFPDIAPQDDFAYANDLVHFIKNYAPEMIISGACYPEIHPESQSVVQDIQHLKRKTDAGCSELITQLFFDNDIFYTFQERCALANIEVPILAGIMPIVNRNQAIRLVKTSQSKLPRKFLAILDKYEHDPIALRDAGIAYAIDQIVDLLTQNVSGIHLYTMNQAETAQAIHQATATLFATDKIA